MAIPDPTIYNAIKAGDLTIASEGLANHPQGFYDTVASGALDAAGQANTSPTTYTLGSPGPTLTLVLDQFAAWTAGTGLRIADNTPSTGDPVNNFVDGIMTTDQDPDTKEITVSIVRQGGSGTISAWNVLKQTIIAVGLTTPVVVADGGWGTTTKDAGRQAWELGRQVRVIAAQPTPPGAPNPGDRYLAVRRGGVPPAGDWAANANDWATWNGASYDFETPTVGERTLTDSGEVWTYTGFEWLQVGHRSPSLITRDDAPSPGVTLTGAAWNTDGGAAAEILAVASGVGGAPPYTYTLPASLSGWEPAVAFTVRNNSGSTIEVHVAGGGLIDGQPFVNVLDATTARFVWVDDVSAWRQFW